MKKLQNRNKQNGNHMNVPHQKNGIQNRNNNSNNGYHRSHSANVKRHSNLNPNMNANGNNVRSKSALVNYNNSNNCPMNGSNQQQQQQQQMKLVNNNNAMNGNTGVVMLVSTILEAKQLNVGNKEAYLPDHLFSEVFKMTKAQFYALRPWKQKQMKRDTGFW